MKRSPSQAGASLRGCDVLADFPTRSIDLAKGDRPLDSVL